MAKRVRNKKKIKFGGHSKNKKKFNLLNLKKKEKKPFKRTFYNKTDFITDLSFIDKYEKDEKERIKIKDKENLIKIHNEKLYSLKICYRPFSNNIELIGNYSEKEQNNIIKKSQKNIDNISLNKKCSYLLIKYNYIIAPILISDIKKIDNKSNNNKLISAKENEKNQKMENKIKIKKNIKNKKSQYFYIHICKRNLINCLLINEYCLINYIIIFLSGSYSGYFEELNKHNSLILKVDVFNLFLNFVNTKINNEFYHIDIVGNGKDEYGEYILKGKMNIIRNIEQYKKENDILNNKNIDKVISFGNIFFHKIYNI